MPLAVARLHHDLVRLLLDTALRVRAAGIVGAVCVPVMTGIIIGVLWIIGNLTLSGFQLNALCC